MNTFHELIVKVPQCEDEQIFVEDLFFKNSVIKHFVATFDIFK